MSTIKIDMDDPEYNIRKFSVTKAYYQSKRAQVMYTYWLAEKLKDTAITVNCIRVTNVTLDMSRQPNVSNFAKRIYKFKSRFSISPEQMAKTYVYLGTSDEVVGITGKYYDENNTQIKSVPYTYDHNNIAAVMSLTQKYLD